MLNYFIAVIPAQAGIQVSIMSSFVHKTNHINTQPKLDSRLRGNDGA